MGLMAIAATQAVDWDYNRVPWWMALLLYILLFLFLNSSTLAPNIVPLPLIPVRSRREVFVLFLLSKAFKKMW